MRRSCKQSGFTIIELVVVIALLGILAAVALPRFISVTSDARIATLEGIEGSMRSTIVLLRSVAYIEGLNPVDADPSDQSIFLVENDAGTSELDWRNLCPEARAELGDALEMVDHIGLAGATEITNIAQNDSTPGLKFITSNQYTRIGYDIRGGGPPTPGQGCYLTYNSFGDPECTIDVITDDC